MQSHLYGCFKSILPKGELLYLYNQILKICIAVLYFVHFCDDCSNKRSIESIAVSQFATYETFVKWHETSRDSQERKSLCLQQVCIYYM